MIKLKVTIFAMFVLTLSALIAFGDYCVAQDGNVPNGKAQNHSAVLADYLTKDVAAVGYINLEKVNATEAVNYFHGLKLIVDEERDQALPGATFADGQIDNLKNAGVKSIYVLLRVSDMASGGPSLVMPIAAGSDVAAAAKVIQEVAQNFPPLEFSVGKQAVYAAASKQQLDQLANDRPTESRGLSKALATISDGSAGFLVCGDDDSRRVVSSIFPALPAPFEMVTGKLLAEQVEWAGVELTLPADVSLDLEFEAKTEDGAKEIVSVLTQLVGVLKANPAFQGAMPADERNAILDALAPSQSGKRVSISLDKLDGEMDSIVATMAPQVRKVRQAARRTQEMNNLRQFALALLNYESAHREFPRADGKSDDHPAGLSWRVHILPFLEEGKLYEQFHLDEPWDSDHNKQLIKFMPPIFRSPLSKAGADDEGLTVFQVPFCKESIFQPNADTAGFRDIRDGSSNTILIVAAADDEGVVWTKPDDWDVDLDNPLKGLQADGREGANVAFCDGSVRWIPLTTAANAMRALITRDGGEVVVGSDDGGYSVESDK
jgi:prepilin-type processing-associated H-X9-DG protein